MLCPAETKLLPMRAEQEVSTCVHIIITDVLELAI